MMKRASVALVLGLTLASCTTPADRETLRAARTLQGEWDRCIAEDVEKRFPLVEGEQGLIYLSNEEVFPVFLEVAHSCRAKLAAMGALGNKDALMRAISEAFDRYEQARGRNYHDNAWI